MTISPDNRKCFSIFSNAVIYQLPIRAKTRATYRSILNRHLSPTLGDRCITVISREDIQRTIAHLPAQTAATTLAVIKTVYREALLQGLIDSSPAHGVSGPKIMVTPRKFLTWEELQTVDFKGYTSHINFLALHGLRWSEALALTPDDIRDGRVYVSKSIHGQTKSRAGVRMVPLVSEFQAFPRSPKTLRKVLNPAGVTIHSLRHTYAYILKQKGVHVTTAQRLLGHSDPRVTLSVYTQVLDTEIDDVGVMLRSSLNVR